MHWFILLIPLFTAWFAKFILKDTITWKEMGVQMCVSCLIVGLVLAGGMYSQTQDTEIWNGRVINKAKVKVSCSHSYSCNCVTVGSGDSKTTVCQTCYDHSHDFDWRVNTTIDDFNISRVNAQGTKEPRRWTDVTIGEPYATEKSYVNYIKAVPESIFSEDDSCTDEEVASMVPDYPQVYDYYRIQRVQAQRGIPDAVMWNDGLSEIAKELGASYEVNPIIQFVDTNDPTYQFALEKKWLNGKKNDVIVVFGVKEYPIIDFVRIVGWENEEIKHRLRTSLELFDTLNEEYREYALSSIRENIVLYYDRMNMEDYEYLEDEIDPPLWSIVTGLILALLLSVGLTYYFHTQDPFNDGYTYRRKSRPAFKTGRASKQPFRSGRSSKRPWRS